MPMLYWIIGIALVLAALTWFFLRKKTLPEPTRPQVLPMVTAPGMSPTTGEPLPAPAPPPSPSAPKASSPTVGPAATAVAHALVSPSAALEHVPVIGRPIVQAVKGPAQIVNRVVATGTNKVAAGLEHIPVVGASLSAPIKLSNSVVSKVTSWF